VSKIDQEVALEALVGPPTGRS